MMKFMNKIAFNKDLKSQYKDKINGDFFAADLMF